VASELARSKVKKLVLERSDSMRISAGAVADTVKITAFILRRIGFQAASRARGFGRRTILEEDIRGALPAVCALSQEEIDKALGKE